MGNKSGKSTLKQPAPSNSLGPQTNSKTHSLLQKTRKKLDYGVIECDDVAMEEFCESLL